MFGRHFWHAFQIHLLKIIWKLKKREVCLCFASHDATRRNLNIIYLLSTCIMEWRASLSRCNAFKFYLFKIVFHKLKRISFNDLVSFVIIFFRGKSVIIFCHRKKYLFLFNILRGYCTPGQFLDCFCIFLKNYNTLVTSKICFL